jgi:hypothetical protein
VGCWIVWLGDANEDANKENRRKWQVFQKVKKKWHQNIRAPPLSTLNIRAEEAEEVERAERAVILSKHK